MAPREALLLLGAQLEPLHHAFRPVVHPEEDPDGLDDIRQLVGRHQMGVCLRLDRSYASNLGDSRSLVEQIDAIGVPAERADVVLDCGFICSAADPAIGVSGPLSHLLDGAWQSVTVAVGSFPGPAFFDGRLTRRVISIPRLEVALWEKIRQRWPGAVDYGDYGVDHPGPPPDEARPVPNLRYTTPEHWRLYQWPKDAFGGHSTFHQLCQSLVRSSDWPQDGPAFSWGDQQIALAACERIGPGSGSEWKAYAVSHHLAAIVDSLQPDGSAE
ncbi:hypothetical protein HS041_14745 [Planomonospora sp. ID67723]|uniref:beta family protein n=1 Tax=Planomonospora sp. ID67723 TaxID=2738134 RepID=UPI0018C39338|nr:hypothetical protein [Planomonospora sp. ID67723]MBG0829028.1 hypothetical protein [Planomonospora sp. ID67723]